MPGQHLPGNLCSLRLREPIDTRTDTGEGNALQVILLSQLHRRIVTRSQQFPFMIVAAIPDRPDGVYHLPTRQAIGIRHLALPSFATTKRPALCQQLRPRGPVYGTIHATATQQRPVRRIHDSIHLQFRDDPTTILISFITSAKISKKTETSCLLCHFS